MNTIAGAEKMSIINESERQEFVAGFICATLWANAYGDTLTGEPPCEADEDRLSDADRGKLTTFAGEFLASNGEDISAAVGRGASWESLGGDLALTGAGHGTGFWDRGYGAVGDRLSEAARGVGYFMVFVAIDGALDVQEG